MNENDAQKALNCLQKTIYATVATTGTRGEPWNSPVYTVYDKQLRFYWASDQEGQHSRNIQANPKAFLVIYDSTVPWGKGQGIYIQATVTELRSKQEIAAVCQLRADRASEATHDPATDFMGQNPRRMYRAVPEKIWINGPGSKNGKYIDMRRPVDIAALKDLIN